METKSNLTARARQKLEAAQAALRRYTQVSGGNQNTDLYTRFVHDVRIAGREYMDLKGTLLTENESSS